MTSVSTSDSGSGAAMPVSETKLLMRGSCHECPHVCQTAGNGRRSRHHRAHQMRSPALSLAPFKVTVRRRGASLPRVEPIVVHRDAHGASGFSPLKARGLKDAVETFGFRLAPHVR